MMLSEFKAREWVYTASSIELNYIKEVNEKGWYILTNGYIQTTIFSPDATPAYPLTIENKVKCDRLVFEYEKLRKMEVANNMTFHVFQEFAFRVFETNDQQKINETFYKIKDFTIELKRFRSDFVASNWLEKLKGGEE